MEGTKFAFYGILQRRSGAAGQLGEFVGPCVIRGRMYSVGGSYPALVDDPKSVVHGTLWRPYHGLEDLAAEAFDMVESYDPANPAESLYVRRRVELVKPVGATAWVYYWNLSTAGLGLVPTGRWPIID